MFSKKPAFTLFEMVITLTIFAFVSVISVTLLVNAFRGARKVQAQVLLYSEAQALMDQIAVDVEQSAVDYEAYYSRAVQGSTGWDTPYYGLYAQTFYDPGTDGTETGPYSGVNASGDGTLYGVECPDDSEASYPLDCPDAEPVSSQSDRDTGAHPFPLIENYSGYTGDPDSMNAFCEYPPADEGEECMLFEQGVRNELILINSRGDERTVYAREAFVEGREDHFLSRVKLLGTDTTNDGVVDSWACDPRYNCTGRSENPDHTEPVPHPYDLTDNEEREEPQDFSILTPDTLNVEQFYVMITPMEDPYRGFAEINSQMQPQVTIVLKVSLSESYSKGLLGEVPELTIQRSISTGVYGPILSYD